MADTKISALPASTTPLAGTEVLPIVQSGATKQVSVANLTAGRAISATSVTASTGNFVVGTSGQGIDFSATSHPAGMTSELLSDYEEGTWAPTQGAGLTVVGACSSSGTYTKVGRIVTVRGLLNGATSIAAISGTVMCGGMPFTASGSGLGTAADNNAAVGSVLYISGANLLSVSNIGASPAIHFGATYFV